MIYTSYFSALRHIPEVDSGKLKAVSIALHSPRNWPIDNSAFSLRPFPYMVNRYRDGSITKEEYEFDYRSKILVNVSAFWILNYYNNSVLCCYESPDKFCHRHIVRRWIKEETGVDVTEIVAGIAESDIGTIKSCNGEQLSMF